MDARGESRAVAIRAWLLGTSSRAGFLLPGVISALVLMLMHQLLQRISPDGGPLPVVFVNILAWIVASLASVVARRARMLWLRAGPDRAGLFALGERTALYAGGLMMLSAAVMLTAYSIAIRPDLAIRILVFVDRAAHLYNSPALLRLVADPRLDRRRHLRRHRHGPVVDRADDPAVATEHHREADGGAGCHRCFAAAGAAAATAREATMAIGRLAPGAATGDAALRALTLSSQQQD